MLFPDGSNGDGYLPTTDPGELLVSPDHHLKKKIFINNFAMSCCYVPLAIFLSDGGVTKLAINVDSEDDDNLYLSDGPVSRSGLADGTRSGSDPEDDNASGSGPGTGHGCGVVSVVSVLFLSLCFVVHPPLCSL